MTKKKENAFYQKCESEPIFAMVKDQKTEKISIVVGNYKVSTKEFNTFKEAETYIASKPYELLINTSVLFLNFSKDENNSKN